MLTMPVAHEHEPHQTRLVERFAAELPRLHFLGGPAAPVVDGDPYREWATITCFGGIRIRVPAAWHCGYDVDVFMWSGYRPGDSWEEHSGVIWLTYDLPADTAAGQRQPDAGALEIPVPEDALDVRRDLASGEQVLRYRQVGDEDGKAVVFTRWMRGIVRDRRLILLQVSLAFPETRAKTPVVARFIEAMDVEVRAAEIDVTKLSMAWTSP